MKKRLRITVFAAILTIGFIGWLIWNRHADQPAYQGRPVSAWFQQYYRAGPHGQWNELKRSEASQALHRLGAEAVPYLIDQVLKTRHYLFLEKPFFDLRRHFFPDAPPFVSADDIRTEAAWSLREIKPPAAMVLPLLADAVKSPEDLKHHWAVFLMGCLGDGADAATSHLIDALKDKDPRLHVLAAQSLWELGPAARTALPAIIQALEKPSCPIRVIDALGNFGPAATAATPSLISRLAATNHIEKTHAAIALCQIDPQHASALATVTEALQRHKDARLCNSTLMALQEIKAYGRIFVPALLQAATNRDDHTATLAIAALESIWPEAAVPALLHQMKERTEENTRIWAAGWILRIEPKNAEALTLLMDFVRSRRNSTWRGYAVEQLGESSPENREVVSFLDQTSKYDRDGEVSAKARKALERIHRREADETR
jgi:HEAT repeat protein